MKKIVAIGFVVGTVCASGFVSADTFVWIGGDGKWSDVTHWTNTTQKTGGTALPSETDLVSLAKDCTATIEVDGTYQIMSLSVQPGDDATRELPVTLTGTGTLDIEADPTAPSPTTLQVNSYRRLVLKGDLTVISSATTYSIAHATLELQGNATLQLKGVYYLNQQDARLVVNGGTLMRYPGTSTGYLNVLNGWYSTGANLGIVEVYAGKIDCPFKLPTGTLIMRGGELTVNSKSDVWGADAVVDFTGGTINYGYVDSHAKALFARNGARYVNSSTAWNPPASAVFNLVEAEGEELHVNGATNIATGSGWYADKRFSLLGGGLLKCKYMEIADECLGGVLDLDRLILGYNLQRPWPNRVNMATFRVPRLMTFVAFGEDWFVTGNNTHFYFEKGVVLDTTDDDDGVTGRRIVLRYPHFSENATLDVCGNGTAEVEFAEFTNGLSRISAGEGTKLELGGFIWNNYYHNLKTKSFEMKPNAKLTALASGYAYFAAEQATIDPSAEITVKTDGGTGVYPALATGPECVDMFSTPETTPQVAFASTYAGWTARFINGSLVAWQGTPSTSFSGTKWTGATDGNWLTGGNWNGAVPQDRTAHATFDGVSNTRVTIPAEGLTVKGIRVLGTTAPLVFEGGTLSLASPQADPQGSVASETCAVSSGSDCPVVFKCKVRKDTQSGESRFFMTANDGRGYVAYMDDVEADGRFHVFGDVRVGAKVTADNLHLTGTWLSRPTKLTVLNGGNVLATMQTLVQGGPKTRMEIKQGGKVTIANRSDVAVLWGYSALREKPMDVDGLFDAQAPLGGSKDVAFAGSGEVRLADTGSRGTAPYTVSFDGSLKVLIGMFVNPVSFTGTPTWQATNDWMYAVAPLALATNTVLTVDTGDPFAAGVAHAVTVSSAVTGGGSLVKDGVGTLTLTSADNDIGGVVVKGGALTWTAPQRFGSLSGNGTLLIQAVGGAIPSASVGAADFTGLKFACDPSVSDVVGTVWTTVLTIPAGASVAGLPTVPDRYRVRILDNGDGSRSVQIRAVPGCVILVR